MDQITEALKAAAIQIRDEKAVGANTANRVGSLLLALAEVAVDSESLKKMFLRKDVQDTAAELIRFAKGAEFGENGSGIFIREGETNLQVDVARIGEFITGIIGAYIDRLGNAEMESLVLRSFLSVPEIRFNRMTYFEGYNVISPGGGFLVESVVDNGDGTWTVTPKVETGEPIGMCIDDIYLTYWHDGVSEGDFKGFKRMQFRVISVDYDAKTCVLVKKPGTDYIPLPLMRLGQTGNFTNKERQTYIIIDTRDGNNCITYMDDANTWDVEPSQEKSWFGKKKGRVINGINCDGYSAVMQDILLSGLIFQIDELTGDSVRVPMDKGEWSDMRYSYYDRVSHNGSLYLCVSTSGATSVPAKNNPDWLEQVSAGSSVTGHGNWDAAKVPFPASSIVSFSGMILMSNKDTSNPPYPILKSADGTYNRYGNNGGYILAGKKEDATLHEDWDLLIDVSHLQDGDDGQDAIVADLTNEMDSIVLTSEGKTSMSYSISTTASLYKGAEKLTLANLSYSLPTGVTATHNANTGLILFSVGSGVSLTSRLAITITLSANVGNKLISREVVFTIACVRQGADGIGATMYEVIPSETVISKKKDGSINPILISCTRFKIIEADRIVTNDGVLKYIIDGGAELTYTTAISCSTIKKSITFIYYVNNILVDKETIPVIEDGQDGDSIDHIGQWNMANAPYKKNQSVNFLDGVYIACRETSNPPYPILQSADGTYNRYGKNGGYILAGKKADATLHEDWIAMLDNENSISYWLDSPVSSVGLSSSGTPTPSSFQVTCKRSISDNVELCDSLYLVARRWNGSWQAHGSAVKSYSINVAATVGYSQFAVRAYRSASDANSWNSNHVAEIGVGVTKDGMSGAFGRDRGIFGQDTLGAYVWNNDNRDKIIYQFGGVYYNFLVKNYGSSITVAPTSASGDSNWEALQKFTSIATDTLFSDGANVAGFQFARNSSGESILKSQNTTNGIPNLLFNATTGYFRCLNAEITGVINSTGGVFRGSIETTFKHYRQSDAILGSDGYYTPKDDLFLLNGSVGSDGSDAVHFKLPNPRLYVGKRIVIASDVIPSSRSSLLLHTHIYCDPDTVIGVADPNLSEDSLTTVTSFRFWAGVCEFLSIGSKWVITSLTYAKIIRGDLPN